MCIRSCRVRRRSRVIVVRRILEVMLFWVACRCSRGEGIGEGGGGGSGGRGLGYICRVGRVYYCRVGRVGCVVFYVIHRRG